MPRIQFISDLHGDFYDSKTPLKPFERCLDFNADYLAVAGDISNRYDVTINLLRALGDCYKAVYWVQGNHDMAVGSLDRAYEYIAEVDSKMPENVHLLKGNVLNVTEKTTIGGSMGYCDFGYAKKVLKARDRDMWAYWERWYDSVYIGLSREEGISLWESELQKMEKSLQLAPTIMVTHFMPSYSLVSKKWAKEITTTFFAFNGNDMLKRFGENGGKIWAFGHTHEGSAGEMNGVKLVCNPFGYPNESVGCVRSGVCEVG